MYILFGVNRDGSQHKIKRENHEYRFDFREEHVGSKLKLELITKRYGFSIRLHAGAYGLCTPSTLSQRS